MSSVSDELNELNEERRILPSGPPADAVDVATLLSTTVRVEPELLRAVRVALLPQADVAAESDLWFSEWVATRNPRAMVLRADVQRELRPRLPEVLARCASPPGIAPADHLRELITSCHRHLSPLMRVEEEVLWLLSRRQGAGAGLRQAEAALRSVLRALVEDTGRAAIGDWIVSVGRRLPEPLRHTVTGWQFRSIASFLEPETAVDVGMPADVTCRDVALVLKAVAASGEGEVPDTHVTVRSAGDVLHLGGSGKDEPNTLLISVPATDPVVLELDPGAGGDPRALHVRAGAGLAVPGITPAARLVAADGRVYDLAEALRAQSSGDTAPTAAPPTVFLGPVPLDPFSREVHDGLRMRLGDSGYEVRDLGALWPSRHRTDDATATWPVRMDAVVFLLDPESITSPVVRDQVEILCSWSARSGAPEPLLVPLRDLPSAARETLTLRVGAKACRWVTDISVRTWGKDRPWSAGHAGEIAAEVAGHVRAAGNRTAADPDDTRPFPTRYQLLARVLDKHLHRYSVGGERAFLEQAVALFSPDLKAPAPADESAVSAFVLLAQARREHARLTDSADEAYEAVRLLRHVVARAPVAAETTGEKGTRLLGRAVNELLRAWSVCLELTSGAVLPDGAAAGLDEAVLVGREVLDMERQHSARRELTACLASVMASEAWLRRHPEETEATARLSLEAAGAPDTGSSTERITAARTAARLAIRADSMPLAVRAHHRWFELLETTDWTGVGGASFAAITEGIAGAAENAAACALAAGEPPVEAVRLLARGLAVHRVVLAGRSLYGHDAGSCQPRWRRRSRLQRALSRLSAHLTWEAPHLVSGEGPVVVLVAADVGGAALILDGGTVTAVPLPALTAAAARRWSPGDPALREALQPAVRELERGSRSGDASRPSRVFWCPTGPLSRLPVHEAWPSEGNDARVAPSYVSSLPEFFGSRHAGTGPVSASGARPVVVVSPDAGDTGWAARAAAEVRAIRSTGMDFDLLVDDQATRLAVLEAASSVEVVHLVSRLVPHNGGGWAIALADGLLTGADIAAADLSRTHLTVLSGYGESTGGGTEPDRDTLAGSLLGAGCRHVVTSLSPPGTPTRGIDAIVTRFYDLLLDGGRRPRPDLVPFALHRASTGVHEQGLDSRPPYHLVHIAT
ncbi:hypothetical protein [Streptomyces sp. NEAU-NA10]|uniref:hypothetical protein n=1 Tax=Streptomyces sp. NEAU-NA10 TaxID=3416050 RepID=UPI003CC6C88F